MQANHVPRQMLRLSFDRQVRAAKRRIAKLAKSSRRTHDGTSFEDMVASCGHLGTAKEVKNLTGYPVELIDRAWEDYKHLFDEFRPTRGKDYTKCYFLLILIWIHIYPTQRNIRNVLHTSPTGFISEATFRRKMKPMLKKLAANIDYIHWENRLRHDNHSIFFPKEVTGIVDCAPIRVGNPRRSRASRKLYQPKYKYAVLKLQIVISFTGEIIYASFPHFGMNFQSFPFTFFASFNTASRYSSLRCDA